MRLRTLTLTNFGPHRHLSLPLAPLTVVTGGNGTGKSHIAEALRLALAGVYDRHDYVPEMRAALQRWADHVDRIVSGEALDNVVEMRGGRC